MNTEQKIVPAEVFDAAVAQAEAAYSARREAQERVNLVEDELNRLSCQATFIYEDVGPYDEFFVTDGVCRLEAGHQGEHDVDRGKPETVSSAYASAIARLAAAQESVTRTVEKWGTAEEAVADLSCNHGKESDTCVKRRGHDGDHLFPAVIRLII